MIDTQQYGPLCHELISTASAPVLGPGKSNPGAFDLLQSMDNQSIGNGREVLDREMADGCRSALWLLHNFLDESHSISQDIHTTTGSYWHAIMHRREPDYSNAKYWFRRVGVHPVYADVASAAMAEYPTFGPTVISGGKWDPEAFVDACQQAVRDDSMAPTCRSVGQLEWLALFEYCYQAAFVL